MKYLLDTNIISETSKPVQEVRCAAWLKEHQNDCGMSTVTLAELRYGVERLPEGKRKRALAKKLNFLLHDYSEKVLGFDEEAASQWGRYIARLEKEFGAGILNQLDYPDTQIASIALANELTLITNNQNDFPGVAVFNPFLET